MNLTRAVAAVEKEFGWFELSHHVESEPWGFESKNKFLNVGMAFISGLDPLDVLHILQRIERSISADSHRNPDGSYRDRVIDIDIIAAEKESEESEEREEREEREEVEEKEKRKKKVEGIGESEEETEIIINSEELTLPHPHLHDRPFFLEPYKELKEIMSKQR